jgi:hypothetical protein
VGLVNKASWLHAAVQALGDISPAAAAVTAAAPVTGKLSSSYAWPSTAAAVSTGAAAVAQRASSGSEPIPKRSTTGVFAAVAAGGWHAWQPDAAVELVGAAGEAEGKAAGAVEQVRVHCIKLFPLAAVQLLCASQFNQSVQGRLTCCRQVLVVACNQD